MKFLNLAFIFELFFVCITAYQKLSETITLDPENYGEDIKNIGSIANNQNNDNINNNMQLAKKLINKDRNSIRSTTNNKMRSNEEKKILDSISTSNNFNNFINPIGTFQIETLNTKILIDKESPNSNINESVTFKVDGKLSKIIRKISLSGTGNHFSSFKLTSYDLKLKNAIITENCFHFDYHPTHPYICVEADFEQIDSKGSKNGVYVTIDYEYTVKDLVRLRKIPFKYKEDAENIIIWIYDNDKMKYKIKNISLQIDFNRNFTFSTNVIAYPEKYLMKKQQSINDKEIAHPNNWNIIQWKIDELKSNEIKNFAINIPKFMSNCKSLNEIGFHKFLNLTWSTCGLWILLAVLGLIIIIFITSFNKIANKYDVKHKNANSTPGETCKENESDVTNSTERLVAQKR